MIPRVQSIRTVTILAILLLLSGCATQMPASEGLVFSGEQRYEHCRFSDSCLFSGEMIGGYSRILPPKNFRQEAVSSIGSRDSLTVLDEQYLGSMPLPSFSVQYKKRMALGSTIPLLGFWQMDATLRLFDEYYLTVARKIYTENTEIVLQRPVMRQRDGGIVIWAFYRRDPFRLTKTSNNLEGTQFRTSWMGVRAVLQTPESFNTGNNVFIRGTIHAGYSPEFSAPLFSFGASINLTPSKNKRRRQPLPPVFDGF